MKKYTIFAQLMLCTFIAGLSVPSFSTTIREREYICSVCHNKSKEYVVSSTNQMRPSSLDGRPGEMARSAVIGAIKKCEKCGFVSYDISEEICPKQNEIIKSQTYKDIFLSENVNDLSKKYQAYRRRNSDCLL